MKKKSIWLVASCLMAVLVAIIVMLPGCGGGGGVPEQEPPPGWKTYTYRDKEMGYALSFDTPSEWLATGPVGEHKLAGWYDPAYAKPPSPDAVWCYWIACSPPGPEPGDPLILAPSQKRVATHQVQGNWSYHLMCVAPTAIFDEQTAVFNGIMESLKPLP